MRKSFCPPELLLMVNISSDTLILEEYLEGEEITATIMPLESAQNPICKQVAQDCEKAAQIMRP
ncbi:4247_t:CDS:2 [Gigaspora rosea]|nr:4247_t:CDS:2 [Gigaspora rosea]